MSENFINLFAEYKNKIIVVRMNDKTTIQGMLIEYDGIIDARNFLGWPISRNIGGFPLSIEVCGVVGSPYVISQYDGHPNAAGHIRLAEAIHEFIKNK